MRKSERGFTALELIVVLTVGISIITWSASTISQLYGSFKTTQAMDNITQLTVAAHSLKGVSGYDAGKDLMPTLTAAKLIPEGMGRSRAGKATNVWGGYVKLVSDYGQMTLSYSKVTPSACIRLANSLLSRGSFSAIEVFGGSENTLHAGGKPDAVVGACTPTGRNSDLVMRFVLG